MVAKLVIFGLLLTIVLGLAVAGAFYYLKSKAEMEYEKQMMERELEHEERTKIFEEE